MTSTWKLYATCNFWSEIQNGDSNSLSITEIKITCTTFPKWFSCTETHLWHHLQQWNLRSVQEHHDETQLHCNLSYHKVWWLITCLRFWFLNQYSRSLIFSFYPTLHLDSDRQKAMTMDHTWWWTTHYDGPHMTMDHTSWWTTHHGLKYTRKKSSKTRHSAQNVQHN